MEKKLFVISNIFLAVVFLAAIFYSTDFSALALALKKANLVFVIAAVFFYLLTHFASAIRYKALLPSFSIYSYFSSHLKGMLASDATPGRIGYSYFVFDMRKKGLKGGEGARMLGLSMASDFLVRGLLALAGVWLFSSAFGQIGVIVILASLAAFGLVLYELPFISKAISKIPFYGERLENAYNTAFSQKTSRRQLAFSIFASFVGAVARGMEWVLIFYALGQPVMLAQMIVASALVTALSFVPLSVSGIGLQEGGGVFLLSSLLGFPASQALAGMLLIRFVDVFTDLVAGGAFFLSEKRF